MKIASNLTFAVTFASLTFLAGCGKKDATTDGQDSSLQTQDLTRSQLQEIQTLYPSSQATASGLHYVVEREGSGAPPKKGQMVTAHYHGTLLDGSVFDSSIERGRPFSFLVGTGRVIAGWDEAFLTMRKGEKRKLILPSNLGYGARNSGPIPPNSVLIFDVELLDYK